jgi:hypothetical protein
MDTLDVNLRLSNLHCYDEGDGIGSAEPYLWTVFFKIDGDTTSVDSSFTLQGTATVVGTPGNHGDLPNHDVDAGENVPIPEAIGVFSTQLKPIPLQHPVGGVTDIGGVMGVVVVLMEEDNTSGSAVAKGHKALDKAVEDSLNALIPTLTFTHQEPTDAEIEAMKKKIGDTVTGAISDGVSVWDWLKGFGNMDDKIGSEAFRFSHNQLENDGASGIGIDQRFRNEGDWLIQGRVTAFPLNATVGTLEVAVHGLPVTLANSPVRVTGPGFTRTINRTTTFTEMPAGTYTVTADEFSIAPGKPSCRNYTPRDDTQQGTVTAGHIAAISVIYTSLPCDR